MRVLAKCFILVLLSGAVFLPPLHAQASTPLADTTAAATTPAPAGQAPDEVTNRITDLVHVGKYAEARQLTTGLLAAYPNDQRLIKAKVLLDKLLAPGDSANAVPGSSQPANNVAPAQPATNANAGQLTGMDKVEYNSLIELARQAQQNPDLEQQKVSLRQFMNESSAFLQKYPDQVLLWKIRAASALSLNDPNAGYEAGQKLLALGAADSNDPNLQQLISKLKIKGWLEKQEAEQQAKKQLEYHSLLGTWNEHFSRANHKGHEIVHFDWLMEFSKVNSEIEGYEITGNGKKQEMPVLRGTILDSGDISWERRWGSDWTPVQVEMDNDHRFMKYAFTATININFNAFNTNGTPEQCTQTITLTKDSGRSSPSARGSRQRF